jgi:hypothetical protein
LGQKLRLQKAAANLVDLVQAQLLKFIKEERLFYKRWSIAAPSL